MQNPELVKFADGMRSTYRAAIPMAGSPDPVAAVRSVRIRAVAPLRDIPVRVYVPEGFDSATMLPIVLFAHGGGFVSGDFDTHDVLARAIANGTHALVAAVDYRLAPEHPYPAGLDDVFEVLTWLAVNAGQVGGDGNAMAVCGDSAGGNLAAASALLARDRGGPQIIAQWLMYATLSNRMDTESWTLFGDTNFPTRADMTGILKAYFPEGVDRHAPLVSPLSARHNDLPPAFIQVGEHDPLRDENVAYATALRRAGVEVQARVYPGQQHGFIQFYKDKEHNPQGESALLDGIEFIRRKLTEARVQSANPNSCVVAAS